jgi:sugar/nucleoside kinase (ribokinase family)
VFLTDGLFGETSWALSHRDWRTVVDAGTLRPGTEALLGRAEVYVASASFARAFLGRDDPVAAVEAIRARGPSVAAVTLGERGWVASFGDRVVAGPARKVAVVDTTGCGDAFHAGVIEGLLSLRPLEEVFDLAAWVAGCCATRLGTRAGIPAITDYPGPASGGEPRRIRGSPGAAS